MTTYRADEPGSRTALIILVWRLGTGPFLDAGRAINRCSLAPAVAWATPPSLTPLSARLGGTDCG
jgi:hypothetical protein